MVFERWYVSMVQVFYQDTQGNSRLLSVLAVARQVFAKEFGTSLVLELFALVPKAKSFFAVLNEMIHFHYCTQPIWVHNPF